MIRFVSLHARATQAAPTGFTQLRRRTAPAPRTSTRPVHGSGHINVFADPIIVSGVWHNPPKPRPHILQGWKSPR